MRWTQTLIPTLKETPAEAEILSDKLTRFDECGEIILPSVCERVVSVHEKECRFQVKKNRLGGFGQEI